MNVSAALLSLSLLAGAAEPVPAPPPAERARAAVATLKETLLAELQKAIAAGGAASAVNVCGDVAARVKKDVAAPDLGLGRTSSRLRNAANVAPEWVAPLLAELEAAPAEKRGPREVTLANGGFGYLEPLTAAPLCLQCHGSSLAPDVKAAIAAKYSGDKAVGFVEGDLRGVAWVEINSSALGSLAPSGSSTPKVEAKGSLDKAIIRRIVNEHAAAIRGCYEAERAHTPALPGKVKVRWVINEDGSVREARVTESQLNNAAVHECLVAEIKRWVFPKPKGGGIVIVSYPLVFKAR